MKNRIIMFAMAAIAAIGMISCGNPAEPEVKTVTIDNVEEYVVSLGEYKNRWVDVQREEVTDEMLEYYTEYFFSLEAQNLENWPADEGDTVIMNYVGKIDGIAFDGGTANNADLVLGSHSYIPGFEEGLIGCKAGDTVTLDLVFPDDYDDSYAGKAAVFEVSVLFIIPQFTDEAVAALNNDIYTNCSEYKYFVEQAINEYALEDYNNRIVDSVVNQVIEVSQFKELPAGFLDEQRQLIVDQFLETATSYNLDVATYLGYVGTSIDELTDLYAKQQVVFYMICKQEGLYPTEEEINENAELFCKYYGYDSVDAYFAENSKEEFIETLIGSKVFEYIISVTNIKETE